MNLYVRIIKSILLLVTLQTLALHSVNAATVVCRSLVKEESFPLLDSTGKEVISPGLTIKAKDENGWKEFPQLISKENYQTLVSRCHQGIQAQAIGLAEGTMRFKVIKFDGTFEIKPGVRRYKLSAKCQFSPVSCF